MNSLDIAIATPLLYGLIKGFSNGLIKEITDLLSLVLGIYIAVIFSIFLEPHLSGIDNYEQFIPILAFAILFDFDKSIDTMEIYEKNRLSFLWLSA